MFIYRQSTRWFVHLDKNRTNYWLRGSSGKTSFIIEKDYSDVKSEGFFTAIQHEGEVIAQQATILNTQVSCFWGVVMRGGESTLYICQQLRRKNRNESNTREYEIQNVGIKRGDNIEFKDDTIRVNGKTYRFEPQE